MSVGVEAKQAVEITAETGASEPKAKKQGEKAWPSKLVAVEDAPSDQLESVGSIERVRVKVANGAAANVSFAVVSKKGKKTSFVLDGADPVLKASTVNLLAAAVAGRHKVKVRGKLVNGQAAVAEEIEVKLMN